MPSKDSMTIRGNSLVERIVHLYGLEPVMVLPSQKGYRNESYPVYVRDGRILNLLLYKTEPRVTQTIKNANAVSDFLASQERMAVRRPVDARIVVLRNGDSYKYASLYTYLSGYTIAWESYTQRHLKLLGKAMSDMHASLSLFNSEELPDVTVQYLALTERMRRYFAQPGVRMALASKLHIVTPDTVFADCTQLLRACRHLPGKHALHMDLVRSNVLFGGTGETLNIAGILDFEKVAWGHPLFDVARTLAFLLVDCKYKSGAKVRKYFLYSGYQKRGMATLRTIALRSPEGQVNVLEGLLSVFLLYDFYKFLRHNPYESLPMNEHFVRTRDLLLARGCIANEKLLQ